MSFPKLANMHASPWAWEIAALVGVFASFAGLVTLLAVFDGRAIFDWKSVTLNTIVSTVSLALRALLLYAIAECVGQWKWIMFDRSERSLMDFERIDLASRGPLGSLYLSWQRNVPWILRLGVVVTVLTLAVDPFSQQLVQIADKVHEVYQPYEAGGVGTPAVTPRAFSYRRGHLVEINETSRVDESSGQKVRRMAARPELSMKAAILRGLSTRDTLIKQQLDFACSDSKCTWPAFQTLAVCSRCTGLAPKLERVGDFGEVFKYMKNFGNDDVEIHAENATAVVLPNGHFLANLNGCLTKKSALYDGCEWPVTGGDTVRVSGNLMSTYGTGDPKKTISMQDLDTMIWSMTVLRIDEAQRKLGYVPEWDEPGEESESKLYDMTDPIRRDPNADLGKWPESPIYAQECALYYCVQTVQDAAMDNAIEDVMVDIADTVRKVDSWKPVSEEGYAPENVSPNVSSLEFDDRFSALKMTDLVLHYANDSAELNDFNISHEAVTSINAYFQELFQIPWRDESEALELVRERITDASVLPNGRIRSHGFHEPGALEGLHFEEEKKVEYKIDNLALSMTIEMRNRGGEKLDTPEDVSPDAAIRGLDLPKFGTTYISRTVYRAEWYWITLHGVIVLFGVFFCVMTMLSAKRGSQEQLIWKNHSLATMRQGAVAGQRLTRVTTIRELEKRATSEKVSIPFVEPTKAPSPSTSEESIEKWDNGASAPPRG